MLFPSGGFIFIFLPVALIGFHILGGFGRKAALSWLAFISIVFYGMWRVTFVPLLLTSILFNYGCALWMVNSSDAPTRRRRLLVLGIVGNVSLLVFYKYLFPIMASLQALGLGTHHWADVILPLGISFFTFTQIGYLIDLSAGAAEKQSVTEYILFVTFFPHLIAGPILHHKEIMPQLVARGRKYGLTASDFDVGLAWFVLGLSKKLLLADPIAKYADVLFDNPHTGEFFSVWAGALSYSIQLYFDFSGYSDMAIGLARMFSIRFPLNFDSPYKSASIIEFWQRWHITLTRYITLYIYNPLSLWITRKRIASGKGTSRQALRAPAGFVSMIGLPLMVTMTLAGIWHGAGLQYVLFGLLHGFYLTVNHAWRLFAPRFSIKAQGMWSTGSHVFSVLLTFIAVVVAQMFFRSKSAADAISILSAMFGFEGARMPHMIQQLWAGTWSLPQLLHPAMIASMLFIIWAMPNTQSIMAHYFKFRIPGTVKTVVYSTLAYIVLFANSKPQSFIYFQF